MRKRLCLLMLAVIMAAGCTQPNADADRKSPNETGTAEINDKIPDEDETSEETIIPGKDQTLEEARIPGKDQTSEEAKIAEKDENPEENGVPEDSKLQQTDPEKSYYGTWKVESVAGTAAAYAMSEEEIQEMLGTSLTYQEDLFLFQFPGKDKYDIQIGGYEEEGTLTNEMFEEAYGNTLPNLGVEQEEVTGVQVASEGNVFGFMFYIIDDSTMLVYYEGVFFEAHKV